MPILYEGRVATQIVGRDITQRKKAERTIQFMAFKDSLTRLPNRHMFRQHLNKVLIHDKDQMFAVMFIDLDRFKIIIFLENMDKEKVTQVAQRLLIEFTMPFQIDCQDFFVTPSIGISIYPTDGADEETLTKNADTAMYLAKERGKNNYQFYTPNLLGVSFRKMELENGLRKALEHNELMIYYQPLRNRIFFIELLEAPSD